MFKRMFVAIVAALNLACQSDDVNLHVRVIIPESVGSVSSGELRLSLLAYDPQLADAPASVIDADIRRFTHKEGRSSTARMQVRGRVPSGSRIYLSVRGYELLASGEQYILWDGLEELGTPGVVVMRPVSTTYR